MRFTPLAALLTAACGPPAVPADTAIYLGQLQPLLQENGLLAERILEAAAQVHNGRSSPTAASATWQEEVVPIARHLHDQALRVDAPAAWAADHDRLTQIWGSRADGYTEISVGITRGERGAWQRGRALADQAKLDEEAWFTEAQKRVRPYGVELDQYP